MPSDKALEMLVQADQAKILAIALIIMAASGITIFGALYGIARLLAPSLRGIQTAIETMKDSNDCQTAEIQVIHREQSTTHDLLLKLSQQIDAVPDAVKTKIDPSFANFLKAATELLDAVNEVATKAGVEPLRRRRGRGFFGSLADLFGSGDVA